jgi:hypothetical protein
VRVFFVRRTERPLRPIGDFKTHAKPDTNVDIAAEFNRVSVVQKLSDQTNFLSLDLNSVAGDLSQLLAAIFLGTDLNQSRDIRAALCA